MKKIIFPVIFVMIFSACSSQPAPSANAPQEQAEQSIEEAAAEPAAQATPACAVGAAPQEVAFSASDGQELSGYFYPACAASAPVVVLMHWAGGDKADWYEIAAWLQNRGLENPFENPGEYEWWDPTWFPAIDPTVSYNVFIFSFRGCEPFESGCKTFERDGWLLDAQAAMQKAGELEGVDATRIAAIGSSIGADGAVDGCLWLNQQTPGACKGALSLSPGDYLNVPYAEAVKELGEINPAVLAWCLADENEIDICNAAAPGNQNFKSILIPNGQHGNMLMRLGLVPLPMQTILDFLETVLDQ